MRIRQIDRRARARPCRHDLCAVLGAEVAFNDPGVAEFGLKNAVMALGDQFLEVVSPFRADASAALSRRPPRRRGYMNHPAERDDLDADRARLARRRAHRVGRSRVRRHHDDPPAPARRRRHRVARSPAAAAAWRWAGPGWAEKAPLGRARDPPAPRSRASQAVLAARWGECWAYRWRTRSDAAARRPRRWTPALRRARRRPRRRRDRSASRCAMRTPGADAPPRAGSPTRTDASRSVACASIWSRALTGRAPPRPAPGSAHGDARRSVQRTSVSAGPPASRGLARKSFMPARGSARDRRRGRAP